MGLNHIEQSKDSEDMTSQPDNQIGNLCSDYHSSILLHTFSKFITFLLFIRFCSIFFDWFV